MATTTPKRVVVSELQETTATLKVGEFDVSFNYKNKAGEAVTVLQVSARNGTKIMNYSVNGISTNINFSNVEIAEQDQLLAAVRVEISDILTPLEVA